jgi:hypothetical protein
VSIVALSPDAGALVDGDCLVALDVHPASVSNPMTTAALQDLRIPESKPRRCDRDGRP